ncbi:MAG: chorismate-binding protein [Cyanothece sp. SIO1E1]|nr:chorismate-binding protein [Cyanothece sp. SIO1E1]
MTDATDVLTLARWMAADFSNQAQAFANPPLFAHIRVCMRPLPSKFMPGLSLYLEQAYDFMLEKPYRIRVLNFSPQQDHILLENYTLREPEKVLGASRQPERLAHLTLGDLEKMAGCDMRVDWTGHSFKGRVKPGKACIVMRNDKTTYLDNEFEVDSDRLLSYDRGRDPATDELVWGSIAGPFEFVRWANFEAEVEIPTSS